MPEEKNEKKATPFAPAREAKKESFTFSDKIKESKSGRSKSFANRISSKIGRDGKPKQTILERTKRDAPFLIAALVALLLLPFLYKYSGSVNDGDKVITIPSAGAPTAWDNRDDFNPMGGADPDEIYQLSGRDSLGLVISPFAEKDEEIKGAEETGGYTGVGEYEGTSESTEVGKRGRAERTDVDIVENTTNIYKKRARAGTRAAFKRTEIKGLPGANMRSANGDKLAVGNWGGNLKGAAKKLKSPGTTSSPKPVSLQPLQAVGKPSGSAFGNTAAAMRQSKDALSKADAKQALRDADIQAPTAGGFGGIGLDGFGNLGSGSGDLKREFKYESKEPWWWDLMKTRSQMEWEKQFNRKWNWIEWGDKLAQTILSGLINCLATGDSGGDVGAFLGSGGGAGGKAAKCCGIEEKKWNSKNGPFTKENCDTIKAQTKLDTSLKCDTGWEEGRDGDGPRKGVIATRLSCLGLSLGGSYGKGDPGLTEASAGGECSDLLVGENPKFRVVPEGVAQKWHIYHWVVAENFVPLSLTHNKAGNHTGRENFDDDKEGILLCSEGSDGLQFASHYTATAATDYLTSNKKTYTEEYAAYEAAKKRGEVSTFTDWLAKKYSLDSYTREELRTKENVSNWDTMSEANKEELIKSMSEAAYDYSQQAANKKSSKQRILGDIYPRTKDMCVIYVAEGNEFEYGQFQKDMVDMFQELINKSHGNIPLPKGRTTQQLAEDAVAELNLMFIEGAAMEKTLGFSVFKNGKTGNTIPSPMLYNRFENAYILHSGTTTKEDGSRNDVNKRKWRTEGTNYVRSQKCNFDPDVRLTCVDGSAPATAQVRKGNIAKEGASAVEDIFVTATFIRNDGAQLDWNDTFKKDDKHSVRTFSWDIRAELGEKSDKEIDGTVHWTIQYDRNGETFQKTQVCNYTTSPEPAPRVVPQCQDGEKGPGYTDANGCEFKEVCVNGVFVASPVNPDDPRCKDQSKCQEGETQNWPDVNGCWWKKICKDGTWTKPEMENPNDPNCDTEPYYLDPRPVRFYKQISKMPKDVLADKEETQRLVWDNNDLDKEWGTCKVDEVSDLKLSYYDSETREYLEKIIAAYTDANKSNKTHHEMMVYDEQFKGSAKPRIGEVLDAIRIGHALGGGLENVPKNTVCAMAKAVGHYSRDPHTAANQSGGGSVENSNTFGAYAAYMGVDSSFFPTMRLTDSKDGAQKFDYRFHGCWDIHRTNQAVSVIGKEMQNSANGIGLKDQGRGQGDGTVCGATTNSYNGATNECGGFHYGHYNWNHYDEGDLTPNHEGNCNGDNRDRAVQGGNACLQNDRKPYEEVLAGSVWGQAKFPLAALEKKDGTPIFTRVWGKGYESHFRNGTIDSYNRTRYHEAFANILHVANVSCGYTNHDTMLAKDVIRYFDSLCNNGMSLKPSNGGKIPCKHNYWADYNKITR